MTLTASFFIFLLCFAGLAHAQGNEETMTPLNYGVGQYPMGGMMGHGVPDQEMPVNPRPTPGQGGWPNALTEIRISGSGGMSGLTYRKKMRDEYAKNSKFRVDQKLVCDEVLKVKSPELAGMQTSEDIENAIRCGKAYDPADWAKDTPPLKDKVLILWRREKTTEMTVSLSQAKAYLLRFAKPGGYSDDEDKEVLLSLASDETVRKALKKELLFAAQGALLSGSKLLDEHKNVLLLGLDELLSIPPPKDTESCRSPKELKEIREASFKWATAFTKNFGTTTQMNTTYLSPIYPFIPSLASLPEAQKNEIKGKMYRTLATGAVEGNHRGLFISKAKLFTKSYVNKLFGDPSLEFTEFSAVGETGGNVNYFLLGTTPLSAQGKDSYVDSYGIHTMTVAGPMAPVEKGKEINPEIEWKHQGETYKAQVKIATKKKDNLIPEGNKPDYDKMWDDKKLSGVVLVSNNLGEFKPKATEHYIQYYAEKGFDFSEPTSVDDTEAWLKKNISDGTVDYVLKDAHTGGNTTYLAAFSKKHKLLKGTKTLADGKKEDVYILAPSGTDDDRATDQTLEYNDMKKWMDQREQDKKGPLVYLNSSCGSFAQAKYEVPAIESPLFVDIPAKSTTTTFVNSDKSTKYHIMEGIRNGKSYEEIREKMKTTERYKKGDNLFQFPDEQSYQRAFTALAEVQVAIKDSKGKTYHLEEAAH